MIKTFPFAVLCISADPTRAARWVTALRQSRLAEVVVTVVAQPEVAVSHLLTVTFNVIVVDVGLNVDAGLRQVAELLVQVDRVPIVISLPTLEGPTLTAHLTHALRLGAQDVLDYAELESPNGAWRLLAAAERATALHELKQSEARYRTIAQLTSDYMYGLRLNAAHELEVDWVTASFTTLTGYTSAEVQARGGWLMLAFPDDRAALRAYYAQLCEGGPTADKLERNSHEYRLVTATGALEWVRTYVHVERDTEPHLTRLLGSARNITQRRLAEEELRVQKETLESLVAVARATTARLDLNATLRNAVSVAARVTGADSGSFFLLNEQQAVTSFILTRTPPVIEERAAIERVLNAGLARWVLQHRELGLVVDTAHDERWVELPDSPTTARSALAVPLLVDNLPIGLLTLVHSAPGHFTPNHLQLMQAAAEQMTLAVRNARLYDELQTTVAQLSEARDVAELASRAKTAFLASMSHELRTPLSAILGYLDLLRQAPTVRAEPKVAQRLAKVGVAANNLLQMINDLLEFSRLEGDQVSVSLERVDLPPFLRALTDEFLEAAHQQSDTLTFEVAPELVNTMPLGVRIDPAKVRQILRHLVSNAIKHTQHGQIHIMAQRQVEDQRAWLVLAVSDTGDGMTEDHMRLLFKPFALVEHSSLTKYSGTGLGLAISHRLCQLIGGDIRVASQVEHGSTFTVRVPMEAPPP